ncbi:RNA polymerase factor sigma-54 [Geobacillus sp. 46C-IIa]|uniref:RNA polymerase factor sigma-54 n=1 Tax=Geobacillus sp. 46C-IIa TaxID=1963025 RepID=UPI0009C0DFE6|nr:RNA polymerase factor sigma-54 [Geobacillus sp. 46C-IIa]OQP07527.1 RNA polymerase factor sigma-54 [Geobacillus sp. 46C-IIa]QNU28307.1 RNA polymerase factor sigma-54 [Geobacillus sp. 46C-IIa]
MRAELRQEQRLQLALTKELVQAIELLQYSALDLEAFLYERSLENPFLEIRRSRVRQRAHRTERDQKQWLENIGGRRETLAGHLLSQLPSLKLADRDERIVRHLITALDEDGYLRVPLAELAVRFSVLEQELEHGLRLVQSLDPPGVGARDLAECLLLQLERLPERDELAETIVRHHFVSFAEKSWKTLAKQLGVGLGELQRVFELIRTLEPRPGIHYSSDTPPLVVPDVIVARGADGDWVVAYNDDIHPELGWNRGYEQRIAASGDRQAEQFIKEKYRQFAWLAKSLEQRKQTLLQLMGVIVERQRPCLEFGLSALKPMTMREVAEDLGVHESTVSRAVRHKYVQTPFGTVELRRFFSSAATAEAGETASSVQVKAIIQTLISAEDRQTPLSDQQLADLLRERHGIAISRRTVAKYREQLRIPSSAKRKQYTNL